MYFLYFLGGVTFNKCWITLSILNCFSPNFQGFILMKNAINNQVGMLGDMFLWLVANLKQGGIYFIKQALPPNKSAGSVYETQIGVKFLKTIIQRHNALNGKHDLKSSKISLDFVFWCCEIDYSLGGSQNIGTNKKFFQFLLHSRCGHVVRDFESEAKTR